MAMAEVQMCAAVLCARGWEQCCVCSLRKGHRCDLPDNRPPAHKWPLEWALHHTLPFFLSLFSSVFKLPLEVGIGHFDVMN